MSKYYNLIPQISFANKKDRINFIIIFNILYWSIY